MSWLDTVLSNSAGVVWRAASGTVDPWTVAVLTQDEADALRQASGNVLGENEARGIASSDVNIRLKEANAHPSQFSEGLMKSFQTGQTSAIFIAVAAGLFVVALVFVSAKAKG